MRAHVLLVLAFLGGGCASGEGNVSVYLEQRLGPDGPPGQTAAVLERVERKPRSGISGVEQTLLELWQGPTPGERAAGMRAPLSVATGLCVERVERGTAYVHVLGQPLDLMGVASVVFSLTELDGVARVRICCRHRHDGTRIFVHTRLSFRGWQGEPCATRRENRCLRDR